MLRDRALFIIRIFLSAVLLAASIWKGNGMAVGTCAVAFVISIPVAVHCPKSVSFYSRVASLTLLICTVIMLTAVPYESMFRGGDSDMTWACISAALSGAVLITQAVLFFFLTASVFKASYNWVLVGGMGWIIGLGFMVIRYLTLLIFQYDEAESGLLVNPVTTVGMLVNLIMFVAAFVTIGNVMKKKRLIITSNGLEAMR